MEPLIPIVLLEFCRVLLALSVRILDMPKSPTRTLMSSARRILLGLRSSAITDSLTHAIFEKLPIPAEAARLGGCNKKSCRPASHHIPWHPEFQTSVRIVISGTSNVTRFRSLFVSGGTWNGSLVPPVAVAHFICLQQK